MDGIEYVDIIRYNPWEDCSPLNFMIEDKEGNIHEILVNNQKETIMHSGKGEYPCFQEVIDYLNSCLPEKMKVTLDVPFKADDLFGNEVNKIEKFTFTDMDYGRDSGPEDEYFRDSDEEPDYSRGWTMMICNHSIVSL